MAKELNELQATRGRFRVIGFVKGIDGDKAYNSGISDSGGEWHSINFAVQTSPTNKVFVQLMGSVQEEVYAMKTVKGENKRESKTFDWDDRYDLPEGYHLMGVRCFIEPDEENEGRYVNENKHAYDAVDYIRDYVEEDDCVEVTGQIDYQSYKGQDGKINYTKRLTIQYIAKAKPIDFTSKDFAEVSAWEQEVVYLDTVKDGERNKGIVQTYTIRKVKGEMTWTPADFVIDGETQEKFLETFPKKVKWGDLITVNGEIINSVTVQEVEEEEEDEFGGRTNRGLKRAIRSRVQEFRLTGISKDEKTKEFLWKKKHYKEEQFVSKADEGFGERTNKKDPFAGAPISDEDLPF